MAALVLGVITAWAGLQTPARATVSVQQVASAPPVTGQVTGTVFQQYLGSIGYTVGNKGTYQGELAVLQNGGDYYLAFRQSLGTKSNVYCSTKNSAGCTQSLKDLLGSDYIAFSWNSGQLLVDVDILTQTSGGYTGTVKSSSYNVGDGPTSVFPNTCSGVTGYSGLAYDWNTLGWGSQGQSLLSSPNFASSQLQSQYPAYEYYSTAVIKIPGGCLPSGANIAQPTITAHDSPLAPYNYQPVTQTLAGVIYLCNNGAQSQTRVSGGRIEARSTEGVMDAPNPFGPVNVAAGTWGLTATAPQGYQFVTCGGDAQPGSPPTTATVSKTVPVGGSAIGIFYVTPVPTTQTIAGHIYDCTAGPTTNEVPGGVLWATGPQSVAMVNNPLQPLGVQAGIYTMSATAPPGGWKFVACGGPPTSIPSPTSASQSVTVPAGSNGTGVFYVSNPAQPPQSLAGHIYDCSTGVATTTEVPGGTLAATGAQVVSARPNPLQQYVAAGPYTMTAIPPPGYQFVACGHSPVITSPTSAYENLLVPPGGHDEGIFYVTKLAAPPISITAVKVNNADGNATWNQTETAPAPAVTVPFRVTITNTSTVPVVITSLLDEWPGQVPFAPTCAQQVVGATLQPSASTTCEFSVSNYAPPAGQSLTNTAHVTACQVGNLGNCDEADPPSTVNTPGPNPITINVVKVNNADGNGTWSQTETAPAAGATVPFRVTVTNTSAVAVTVTSLVDVWPGVSPVAPACVQDIVGQTLAAGQSATCEFAVANYAPAAGQSLTDNATVTACQVGNPNNCASGTDPSTVNVVQVLGTTIQQPTIIQPTVVQPTVTPTNLAFTGPSWQHTMGVVSGGLLVLVLGLWMVEAGRDRRAPAPERSQR